MSELLPTQEVGSLAKPRWMVKGYAGDKIGGEELKEVVDWGSKLGFKDVSELIKTLKMPDSKERKREILKWSARYAIHLLEVAGLDIVFDGEQWRSEMYEHVIRNVHGFEFLGYVRSFDYRYFKKAACIDRPEYIRSFYLDEFLYTRSQTKRKVKIPFTGPYTLVDWSFNEYYEKRQTTVKDFRARRLNARRELIFDLIKNVIRPEIKALVDHGAKWIQIDEPAATTNPSKEEMELFVEAFNETVKGFDCIFSLHNCYSDYKLLAKYACELKNCYQLSLEFANRDSTQPGTDSNSRVGYGVLKNFEDYGFEGKYAPGVIDVHTNFIEPPELVRDRLFYVAKIIRDPRRIYASPDCGLRTRSWDVSFTKLKNMVLGANMAREILR